MKNYKYAVTLRKTRTPIVLENYFEYLDYLQDFGILSNVNFEDTRGLHAHFTFQSENPMTNDQWHRDLFGWSICYIPIYDESNWMKYCRKDSYKSFNLNCIQKYIEHVAGEIQRTRLKLLCKDRIYEYIINANEKDTLQKVCEEKDCRQETSREDDKGAS